jgi:cleavage and polyadenylation specificity factor subunit 2
MFRLEPASTREDGSLTPASNRLIITLSHFSIDGYATMLRVTPIYGSRFDAKGASDTPSCTLVEYGNVSVLVNVGWDESCASNTFPELPSHQVLVITDSSLGAIGGLPQYRREHKGIPIYATYPTAKMGQMTLNDYHAAISLDGGAPPFSLDDLDDAFASLKTLKYSQSVSIHDPISGKPALSVTAHRAGYVVGAAFYVFQRLQDETSVVFTSVYHIAKELHLDSSTLLKHGSTPDVLVTHPGGPAMGFLSKLYGGLKPVLMTPVVNVAEKTLIETILAVLRRDGNVLMPIDASGRVLEYILLLSQHWDRHRLAGAYNLCWVAPLAQNTLDYARSQLEWMAAPLGSQFDSQRGHPYQLHNVDICSSLADLDAVMENGNPTCVLASGASLDCGPARDLLLRWADNPDNAIILPDSSRCTLRAGQKSPQQETSLAIPDEEEDAAVMIGSALQQDASLSEYSTAAQLMMHWCRAKLEEREMDDVVQVDVLVPTRAPLAGNELKDFLVEEEEARQKKIAEEKKRALLEEVELAKGQLRLGEEDITPAVVTSESSAAKNTPTPMAIGRPKKKSRFDSTLFLKFSKPLHRKYLLTFRILCCLSLLILVWLDNVFVLYSYI